MRKLRCVPKKGFGLAVCVQIVYIVSQSAVPNLFRGTAGICLILFQKMKSRCCSAYSLGLWLINLNVKVLSFITHPGQNACIKLQLVRSFAELRRLMNSGGWLKNTNPVCPCSTTSSTNSVQTTGRLRPVYWDQKLALF